MLVYLAKVIDPKKDTNHKIDGRTLTIFENGTYSNMLLRSLGKNLYAGGYSISTAIENSLDKLVNVSNKDVQSGYIYILKSLSTDDRIITKANLYKIGFSTTDIETRISNAKNDPTYLMADVQTVSSYEVYNVSPHKLEQLIHKFFARSCLDVDIVDTHGKLYRPREWFTAPLAVIERTI